MLFGILAIVTALYISSIHDIKATVTTTSYSPNTDYTPDSSDFRFPYNVDNHTLDMAKAYKYIISLYNAHYGLIKESKNIDKYWLWSDNVLAAHILGNKDHAIYTNITNTLQHYTSKYNIIFISTWASLFNHSNPIIKQQISFKSPVDKNLGGKIWYTEYSGNNQLKCSDYADIAFLKSIYLYDINKSDDGKRCYDQGSSMFDGVGFKDEAFNSSSDHPYSTYKLALWKIASDITGFGGSERFTNLISVIAGMQDTRTGGVYTYYNRNLMPNYQTNAETTILAIMGSKSHSIRLFR